MVVAQGDGAAADQALAGDLEAGGDDDDVVSNAAQGAGGRGGELAVVEVLVGEQAAQVGDDLGTALFDAAERVHPVRVAGVNAREQAGVTPLEAGEQGADGGGDAGLVVPGDRVKSFDAGLGLGCGAAVLVWRRHGCSFFPGVACTGSGGAGSAARRTVGRHRGPACVAG